MKMTNHVGKKGVAGKCIDFLSISLLSWFNLSQQLSTTQFLAHFLPVEWGRQLEK